MVVVAQPVSLVLRMLSEDDEEDLRDGLEPLELPQKRLILVPLADRQDGDGAGRGWWL